jgi:TolB-like protein/DNA-binding winged helix-turn-helix (wHTH) protein/Tfp pilus assembly protein PilF
MERPHSVRFDAFEFDLTTLELRRHNRRVRLAPQPARVLAALLRQHNELVTRDALKVAIWAENTFVEFDEGLRFCIKRLRAALGDDAREPRFIETIPKRGYRFIAPVSFEDAEAGVSADTPVPPQVVASDRPGKARIVWTAAGVLAVTVLSWLGASQLRSSTVEPGRIESLAVLPIGNLSGDDEQDYLAESMTDTLITSLGQIGGLRVISRTSVLTYTKTSKTIPQIARELNVDAVVEGTLQRAGSRARFNLKLIEAATDRTVWAESYESELANALDVQNEIARAIVSRTAVKLTPGESARLAEPTRLNPKVYEAYLKGRYLWNRRSEPDMRQAIEHFQEALRLDPGYAPAQAGLADCYALYGSYGWTLAEGRPWERALAAAEKALELDERLADAHTSRARIALNYELDWTKAGEGYRRALELNPGYANAHHWYGYYLMLSGRLEEGGAEMRRALELDPLSPIINANVGMPFYVARQYDAAIAHWQKALEMHRNYRLLHDYLTMAYVGKKMYEEAIAELQKGLALSGTGPWEVAIEAHIYGRMGRRHEAQALVSQIASQADAPAYFVALAYAGLGDNDSAFKWLEKTVHERTGPFNEVNADPMFDSLRGDARFARLVQQIGLPVS